MAPGRYIVIHGHFYQPPRENPWLEAVEVQDSAAPDHDWNVKVTAQCYAPNSAARRVDGDNRILDVVNNYEKISFNVGPTLFAWLAREAPEVYRKIVDADRASVRARGGHGNAIAQVYNHMILPLASRRDKVTQVRWGIEDFRARFGREPEGMWLPETAVDDETLEVLAEAGITFTVLAPHQARRVRPAGDEAWTAADVHLDSRRPYRWRGPRGLELAIFFYDDEISRGIAFGDLLERGEQLVARLRTGFDAADDRPQLVHGATDGESYGHHRRFGDMALAAALEQLETEDAVVLTNYGAFLAVAPPTHEVQVQEQTSWSCVHGIERWRSDCGCRLRADLHQRWRGPLREAFDWLRDQIDPFFEARAGALLKDPWGARDDYVRVLIDRGPEPLEAFLARHQRVALDGPARLEVRRLLEMQRNRLLMYTSCGWFFDELSAIEPVQVLRYAAMAMQYMRDLGGGDLEPGFVRRLEAAPSNAPDFGDGGGVYRRLVKPAVVDLRRVVAHYAITGLFDEHPESTTVYAYRVERLDEAREASGSTGFRIGRVRVSSTVTGDRQEATYAVLHFGGHDFACGCRGWEGQATYDAIKADLLGRYASYSLADMVRGLDEHFPGGGFSLTDLFLEERRRVLTRVIASVLDRHEETYRQIWEENRKLVHYLRQADAPIPEPLALVARYVLQQEIVAEVSRMDGVRAIPARVFELTDEARALGLTLDPRPVRVGMQRAIHGALDAVAEDPSAERIGRAHELVEGAMRLGFHFGLWAAQNRFFEVWRIRPEARPGLVALGAALGFNLTARRAERP